MPAGACHRAPFPSLLSHAPLTNWRGLHACVSLRQCVARKVRARVRVAGVMLELCKHCAEAQAARHGSGRPPSTDALDDGVRGCVFRGALCSAQRCEAAETAGWIQTDGWTETVGQAVDERAND